MEYKEIQDLIKLINKTNVAEFKMKKEDIEIVVRTNQYSKGGDKAVPAPQAPSILNIPSPSIQQPVVPQAPLASTETNVPAPLPDLPNEEVNNAEQKENYLEIKSPIVGTFYRSSSPDKPPFIKVGDSVEKGNTVCIVEAMKLFNEIESEISGKVVKVMVEDASPVQYDQVLFLVDPKG